MALRHLTPADKAQIQQYMTLDAFWDAATGGIPPTQIAQTITHQLTIPGL